MAGAHGRVTVTIQVHIRHRARETARELKEWMTSSLEDILVEGGLWETGTGSPALDKPRIVAELGGSREESPASGEGDLVRWTTDFAQQIRTWFEERRGSRIPTPKEMVSSVLGHIGKKEGRSMIACLKDWLEESLLNSQIEFCNWGHEDENGEPKKGVLGDHLCTLIEPTPIFKSRVTYSNA